MSASGCGELGGDTRPARRSIIVTDSTLDRYERGTPARAFLEWFRALQLRDSRELARYYVPSLGLTPDTLAGQRNAAAYAIDPLAPPIIEEVDVNGQRARVLARSRTGRIWPNGRVEYGVKAVVPFELRRERGRWLLASNGFLELVAGDAPGALEKRPGVLRVSPRQLSRYPAGSPARAFLEWFAALQRSDARTAARHYAPALGLSARELARQRELADPFDRFGAPRIVGVAKRGDSATVTIRNRALLTGSETEFEESSLVPFKLQRMGGRWVLVNNSFLELLAHVPGG